ncbi:type II toxin-antitoxin system HipA family toxin [Bacteroides coprosuis]|uniref:type II toxin-antitoxin system HipA family toxin n=1 Tax=Bacteroides coprosuis TaxID=151276 RepID=UPI001D2A7F6C|nr:type II toxin-antitoxin system HipA family toxin [Bacteroides coprosuis]HJD92815.1 type II toxin-antitoxin system HipA family toxin [Bacteroides coprosuis]
MDTNVIKVTLWGMDVGYLYWDKKQKLAVFEYEVSFLEKGLDIAPLSMSINSQRSKRGMPWLGGTDKLYVGLPPMLADSLPDKYGNSLFIGWLRENKISTKQVTPVDHLSFIGTRAMGALEFEPAKELGRDNAFDVDVQKLYLFAKEVLSERGDTVLRAENSILWQDLIKISSSPGGKRPKAIIAINKETNEVKSGQGTIPNGFEHYILKYDDNSSYPYAKLEYVYYLMAVSAGIHIMPSELKTYEGVTHFLTKRFDRVGNEKLHVQTLAAMNPLATSYEELFAVIRRLNLPYEDSEQQYLRMVFNVLAKNVEDHSRNFAFIMNKEGVWRLSPAYDITFSVDLTAPTYANTHALSINGKDDDIAMGDLIEVAKSNDIRNYKALIAQVQLGISKFETLAIEIGIDKKLIVDIKSHFI